MAGFIRSYWAMPFIVIFYLARGVATPILKDSINRIAPAPMRATILSVRNFIIRRADKEVYAYFSSNVK